jgi:hypothetical protein
MIITGTEGDKNKVIFKTMGYIDGNGNPVSEERALRSLHPLDLKYLNKRELFAAMAILKLAKGNTPSTAAKLAVEYADALIKELNKE